MQQRLDQLPSPCGLPLLGNLLQLRPDSLHTRLEQWAQKLGPMFTVRMGPRRMLAVGESQYVTQVLRDRPEGFSRLSSFQTVFQELGVGGVFAAEGESWKRQRRVWMASLNAQQLRGFHSQLGVVTGRLLRRWQNAADTGEVLDVSAELMRYTVDVTMYLALGHDANTLEQGEDVIQRHLNHVFPALQRRNAAPFPIWRYVKRKQDKALDVALQKVTEEAAKLIARARQRLAAQASDCKSAECFLEALLLARAEDGSEFSKQDIISNCLTALLAGEDTTANTLAWAMHYFCQHADVFQRVQQEADTLLGDGVLPDASRFPPWLDSCDAVINETLRLKPIAPLYYLTSLRPCSFGHLQVPADTDVILLARHAAGSSPNSQPAPQFTPFQADPGGPERGPGKVATLPFGYGPRMCPGRNLALAELRSVVLMLARHFNLEAVDGPAPVKESLSFTLVPENLRIRLHRRGADTTPILPK